MTIDRIMDLACGYFKVNKEDLLVNGSTKCTDDVAMARHCMRGAAVLEHRITPKEFIQLTGVDHSTISHSVKAIKDGYYEREYAGFKAYIKANDIKYEDVVEGNDGIVRITHEVYDERLYSDPTKTNPRTGNHFFPAYHYICSKGAPENIGLNKWRKDLGHHSDYVLERSVAIGSYVHDAIDMMIKHGAEITKAEIASNPVWHNAKEVGRVYDCLLGFLGFVQDEEPQIISSEHMFCAEDFGFTVDLECRIKSDNYKNKWVLDWKTSKTVNDDHKMQVAVIRKEVGADRCGVVVLGSRGKNGYTKTDVPIKDHDFWYKKFQAIKETAYIDLLKSGTVKPREDRVPDVFTLKGLNIKKL